MHLAHAFLGIHSSEQALKIQMFSQATKCGTSTTAWWIKSGPITSLTPPTLPHSSRQTGTSRGCFGLL